MNDIHYYLNKPKQKETTIVAHLHRYAKVYKISTGILVPVRFWNQNKQEARFTKEFPHAATINLKLKNWETVIMMAWQKIDTGLKPPDQLELRNEIKKIIHADDGNKQSLLAYAQVWIAEAKPSKQHTTALNIIKKYEKEKKTVISFMDIDEKFYMGLKRWLEAIERIDPQTKRITYGYSVNSIGSIIKTIKTWMKNALAEKLHTNYEYRKALKVISEDADAIYLSIDELIKIYNVTIDYDLIFDHFPELIKTPHLIQRRVESLINVRNRFLIGAFSAMRYQDYKDIVISLSDGTISRRNLKTNIRTTIPMHWVIKNILIQTGGVIPAAHSNQKFNKALKILGKVAGINQIIEKSITVGKKKVKLSTEKYNLIQTHTARRSACTNMYLAGIPIRVIMSFSGHKKESTLLKYIRVSQFEDAIRMKNHPYFTGE